jgi:non-specific protein-tyrosine kinase
VGVTDLTPREEYNTRLLNTYREMVTSTPFLEQAVSQVPSTPPDLTMTELRKKVLGQLVENTELLSISVSDGDPVFATDMANTLAEQLVEYPKNLYVGSSKSSIQIIEDQLNTLKADLEESRRKLADMMSRLEVGANVQELSRQIDSKEQSYNQLLETYQQARLNQALRANSITVLAPAAVPRLPSNSLGLRQIALSVILGLLGGIALALILENVDKRIHSVQQLEYLTNLPVLGVVPRGVIAPGRFEQAGGTPQEREIKEAYRVLIPNMKIFGKRDTSLHSILITSALAGEGKTMVATNLSQALAEQGQMILLVEGNLRQPTLGKLFGVEYDMGLSDLLRGTVSPDAHVVDQLARPTSQTNLFLVCGGPEVTNPTTLLASSTMSRFLDFLDARQQFALVDSTPVLGMADASVLASRVSGVILVVSETISDRESVLAALRQLQSARARMAGMIFVEKGKKKWM